MIDAIDHLVLTVLDVEASLAFYARVLGMVPQRVGAGRGALHFGVQKINLQQLHVGVDPNTRHPSRGSGDFCLLTSMPIENVMAHLAEAGVAIVEGPIERTGAQGPIRSVYFYDPDENLVEVANQC
ncbi:VOC family protein [Sphingomonas elodea]|jgi:catechol 2,3-dioxygenase-like lactoylglutathione lyase family enzyme|uniref:VOC family protein n=1 Tax=Sphingomonas elodea TaxID=179878 RepID=UPI000263139F|nr:VOC family protein [Sphingomonas elodea]